MRKATLVLLSLILCLVLIACSKDKDAEDKAQGNWHMENDKDSKFKIKDKDVSLKASQSKESSRYAHFKMKNITENTFSIENEDGEIELKFYINNDDLKEMELEDYNKQDGKKVILVKEND